MDKKRDYFEDVRFLKSKTLAAWFILLLAGLMIFPLLAPNYYVYLANYIAVNVMVAIGLNILIGYTGQISLGHAGFLAIGAYATVLLMAKLGMPFIPAIVIAALVSAGFGFVLGLPALRLEGPYLAIATLGFGMAVTQLIGRIPLFGGHTGLQTPPLEIGPFLLKGDKSIYFVIIIFTVLLALAARNIVHTRVGRAFMAIRDSEIAAQALGVNIAYYKTLAFALSAFYAGFAGGLLAFVLGFINPHAFDLIQSILFLMMVLVGGPGSILGSIIGAAVITFLNVKLEAAQNIPYLGDLLKTISENWMSLGGLPHFSNVLFGLILVLIVIFEKMGLYGIWLRIKIYWRTWPF
jgi:branched-chain amino acid transport system permease protein